MPFHHICSQFKRPEQIRNLGKLVTVETVALQVVGVAVVVIKIFQIPIHNQFRNQPMPFVRRWGGKGSYVSTHTNK
jgi:hypothetical protein